MGRTGSRANFMSMLGGAAAASLLAVSAPTAVFAESPAPVPFSCSFAGPWSSCGFAAQARSTDRITGVEVAGMHGVRLETLPGDEHIAGSGRAERTDLALSQEQTGCSQGAEQWWTHALFFPDDYSPPQATAADSWPWGVVFDFHQTGSEGQANFEIDVVGKPPELQFSISGGPVVSSGTPGSPTRHFPIGPIIKNHWYRFVYHVRWSAQSDGFFDAWVDGRRVLDYRGATLYAGQGCYLKLANYHTPVGRAVAVVHAQLARAATRETLGLASLKGTQ
ncbi:MAG TPA: heparin lyase I family protein [Candidatus Dormibacteraeota bacterium]|nr:heparin lyase I family protein [Candidatus Dormibacteraeota bacterium]